MKRSYVLLTALVAVAALALAVAPETSAVFSHLTPEYLVMAGSLAVAKEQREKRANLAVLNGQVLDKIKAETDGARVKELETEWDKRDDEIVKLTRSIEREERQHELNTDLSNPTRDRLDRTQRTQLSDDPKEAAQQQRQAFGSYLRFGREGMTEDERGILFVDEKASAAAVRHALQMQGKILRSDGKEQRDLSTGTSGAVLPTSYWDQIAENLLAFGGMREAATVIQTGDGNAFVLPTLDDTGNVATLVSEAGTTSSSVDPTLASLTLNAYTYRSFMLVSREMLQDASFDIDSWVTRGLSTRLARGLNTAFTTGDGSSKPNGIATASSSAGTMGSGTAVTITDLSELEHAVDPSQRKNARWMFHDKMLRNLKRMADTTGQPIWQPGVQVKGPDTIYGYPFTVNQDVAQPTTAGGKVLFFGDFSKYIIRDVPNQNVILRLVERYAEKGQIGFFLFSRHDGDLLDAGTDPIKHMVTGSPQS